ncbi:CDP-glucose 4,6-dehydratase [Brevibacillus panacihumi]|uniref:CDP-glucose 4,6-dehydratase n=1 Tax=Brevibacillus panacihumi TaxID=497735 RepID=UPI003D1A8550
MVNSSFWHKKRVLVTGHTGFKGAWLSIWLHAMGAEVTGYALEPPTDPSLFRLAGVGQLVHTITADIRDRGMLEQVILQAKPEIIFHLAAQSLVRQGYQHPVETYETNVLGTVYLLEAVRLACQQGVPIRAVINVTSDKCYENREWVWGYREQDALGGRDPYSSSKACAELVTASYRNSFFSAVETAGIAIASARAGNVIGGGDWAADRLIPDCLSSLMNGKRIKLRYPEAVRPWQHVLEPLGGYLLLAERMCENAVRFSNSYNFGPDERDTRTVAWVVQKLCEKWGAAAELEIERENNWPEASLLKLDCSRAKEELGWRPRWSIEQALEQIVEWTKDSQMGKNLQEICKKQIQNYMEAAPQ